jgi:hypothetical protein
MTAGIIDFGIGEQDGQDKVDEKIYIKISHPSCLSLFDLQRPAGL